MIETFIENSQSYQFRRHILKNYTWQSIVKNKIIPLLEEKGVESHD